MTEKHFMFLSDKWNSAFVWDLPHSLLQWFACDCAERCFFRELEKGRVSYDLFILALQCKRDLLLGGITQKEMDVVYHKAGKFLEHIEGDSTNRHGAEFWAVSDPAEQALYYTEKSMMEAASTEYPEVIARGAANMAKMAAFVTDGEAVERTRAYGGAVQEIIGVQERIGIERAWQVDHIRYLYRVWQVCGERSPFLLAEGTCPIEKEAA